MKTIALVDKNDDCGAKTIKLVCSECGHDQVAIRFTGSKVVARKCEWCKYEEDLRYKKPVGGKI